MVFPSHLSLRFIPAPSHLMWFDFVFGFWFLPSSKTNTQNSNSIQDTVKEEETRGGAGAVSL